MRRSDRVGEIREKLAKVLARDLGIDVDPEQLKVNYNRSIKSDQCKWEGAGTINGVSISFYSYSTMKECVRNGVSRISRDQVEANC